MATSAIQARTRLNTDRPLSVAILAMGGQGGGVLTDWIVHTAEAAGWMAQSTSVPGVAQRTGATIYYIEMYKAEPGKQPIFALMPTPGDVDIVIAAELMEAGRSILRGLVTPDRTTLIVSDHRALAVSEKESPGDGIANGDAVHVASKIAAKRTISFNMQALAEQNGSFISATLFGALAGSNALPFPIDTYREAIRAGGISVRTSLVAFDAALSYTMAPPKVPVEPAIVSLPQVGQIPRFLELRLQAFPETAREMIEAGLGRLMDYQDQIYAKEYLDRLEEVSADDQRYAPAERAGELTREAAKYLANAMAYDDLIKVADLKTRGARFNRISKDLKVQGNEVMKLTEFMHPRAEELIGFMPYRIGQFFETRQGASAALDRTVNKGRRVNTSNVFWFMLLYVLGGSRRYRRITLRHAQETRHIQTWLRAVHATVVVNYDLAIEAVRCRRLIKGYSDTFSRGTTKFARVMGTLPMLTEKPDGAAWLSRLRNAALAEEGNGKLEGAIKTVESIYG